MTLSPVLVPIFVHRGNNPNQHPALICSEFSHFYFSACQLHTFPTLTSTGRKNSNKKNPPTICKNRNSHVEAFSLNGLIHHSEQSSSSVKRWPLRWNVTFTTFSFSFLSFFLLFIQAEKKKSQSLGNKPQCFTLTFCPESYEESLLQRRLHSSTSALQSLKHRASALLKPMKLQIGPI